MKTISHVTAGVAVAMLLLAACGGDSSSSSGDDPGIKAGGDPGPVTITIADSQPAGKPSNLPLTAFAAEIAGRSDGTMSVEVVDTVEGGDEAVIEQLRAGDVEMAVVPARAWSTAGVDSLQPLQAPFLVQSDEHADAIVRDDAVVSGLFAGLDTIGVRGLTMFPESLRHLFSYTTPILTPEDVAGRHIRYLESPEVARLITALGATPVDTLGEEYIQLVEDGTITGFDSGFAIAQGSNPRLATATGNLVLYPKVITFVANAEFWDGLTDEQRATLSAAADHMQDWAITNHVSERAAADEYCSHGGTVVLTDPESVTQFRALAAPIYTELEQDVDATAMIDAIGALAPTTRDATAARACRPRGPATVTEVVADGGELPDGVYRVEYTDQYLRDLGMAERDIPENDGVWTYRLDDGRWSFVRVSSNGETEDGDRQAGVYQVVGDRLYWRWQHENEGMSLLTWSVDDDGTLHFTEVRATDTPDFVFGMPFTRIGDL